MGSSTSGGDEVRTRAPARRDRVLRAAVDLLTGVADTCSGPPA